VEDQVKNFILLFTSIVYEAFPFVVLGSLIAGLLEELVPQQLITRVLGFLEKHFPPALTTYLFIGISGLLGIVFPMCECGIIPVMRRLLRKGLPLSCCVAYILAGPIINPVVMMSTYYAFKNYDPADMGSFWMVLLRCAMGYVVACVTASVVHRSFKKHGFSLLVPLAVPPQAVAAAKKREAAAALAVASTASTAIATAPTSPLALVAADGDEDEEEVAARRRSISERLGNISETALHDFIDIMVFLVLGAALAATLRLVLPTVSGLDNPFVATAFMMLMAVMMCLCSEADAFVAANFPVPPAAKLAFLVLGPMLDFKLYLMYTRVFRPRLIWTIITCVVVQVYVYSIIMHFVWQNFVMDRLRGSGG
jgi:uncharacterized membrane protein YraQ (UPF0718 family)